MTPEELAKHDEASRRGRGSRVKGHAFENRVKHGMRVIFGGNVERTFQFRYGGKEGSDVKGTPFSIECKTGKVIGWLAAYKQACADSAASDGKPPIVVGHYTGGPTLVLIGLPEFAAMLAALSRSNPPPYDGVLDDVRRIVAHVTDAQDTGLAEDPGDVLRAASEYWEAILPSKVVADPGKPKRPRKRGSGPTGAVAT